VPDRDLGDLREAADVALLRLRLDGHQPSVFHAERPVPAATGRARAA
jgi:hypothetical protein